MRRTGFAGPADGTGVTASVRFALGSYLLSHTADTGPGSWYRETAFNPWWDDVDLTEQR
jgi:hypothetical protein